VELDLDKWSQEDLDDGCNGGNKDGLAFCVELDINKGS
jgi:hypothetical protein